MKRMTLGLAALALLGGCATSQMKSTPFYSGSERVYTGRPENRVNLWPVGYYREPALSVLWPLFSLTDDHLAVRPIYSQYRQGGKDSGYDEFNFIWPFCQFDTKHDEHRIFPFYWGDGHVDFFPLVWWRFNKSFTFFPLAWWKKDRYCNVFPLWWSDNNHKLFLPFYYQDENSLTVIPFYGSTKHVDSFSQWIGPYGRYRNEKHPEKNYDWCLPFYYRDATSFETPLFGWDRNDRSSWAFPFYYKDHSGFVSLPWVSGQDKDSSWWIVPPLLSGGCSDKTGSFNAYLMGFGGHTTKADGNSSQWVFPLFYHDRDSFLTPFYGYIDDDHFYSPLWVSWNDEEKKKGGWCMPPLLSWGTDDADGWSQKYLLGLSGVAREKDGKYADWLAPFYYRDENSFFSLPWCEIEGAYVIPPLLTICDKKDVANPLFGWNDSCSWVTPLYYKNRDSFFSLLYCRGEDEWRSTTNVTHVVPPLLSWVESSNKGDEKMRFLLGLGGVNTATNGDVDCNWAFPLYYNDERSFISLLFGHEKGSFTYVTPLFGVTHEQDKTGAWLWPLYGWANDTDMEAAEAMLNADRLDPKIAVKTHATEWQKGSTSCWYEVTGETRAHDSSWRLSGLSTSDRWICWAASDDGKTVTAEDESDFGNFFAYKSDYNRTVKFDYATKKKISDEENGESGLLCNLLWRSKHEASNGHKYDMKSILWRFWHYEKLNGDVTVDSFPFFTYDSKTNGFSKTSLLWRLFRNEYDPEKGRAVDVLFIPVWR